MFKTTIRIDGMMCSMCEAHVNDAIRKRLDVKKVRSSHKKGETVVTSEKEFTRDLIEFALKDSGYKVLEVQSEPYQKHGFFHI
ncbi:MAG: heavy-metal-associated domain-containing protein [Ruminococcus sp.]|nr:heavy-metal-associated domain-containing protein [Ruminococcus sp.]